MTIILFSMAKIGSFLEVSKGIILKKKGVFPILA